MKRLTISIPKDLKKKLDALPDINWPEVARKGIEKKLALLWKLQELERCGECKW